MKKKDKGLIALENISKLMPFYIASMVATTLLNELFSGYASLGDLSYSDLIVHRNEILEQLIAEKEWL